MDIGRRCYVTKPVGSEKMTADVIETSENVTTNAWQTLQDVISPPPGYETEEKHMRKGIWGDRNKGLTNTQEKLIVGEIQQEITLSPPPQHSSTVDELKEKCCKTKLTFNAASDCGLTQPQNSKCPLKHQYTYVGIHEGKPDSKCEIISVDSSTGCKENLNDCVSSNASSYSCICYRPEKYVVCESCGFVFYGRIQRVCLVHPGLLLMDHNQCGHCKSYRLREVTPLDDFSDEKKREFIKKQKSKKQGHSRTSSRWTSKGTSLSDLPDDVRKDNEDFMAKHRGKNKPCAADS